VTFLHAMFEAAMRVW